MQSAEERRRLLSRFDGDSLSPFVALLICAAGILALVVVTAGPWLVLNAGGSTSVATVGGHADPRASKVLPHTLAESKRVFDERRQNYDAARQGTAAGATNGAGDRLLARE